MNFKHYIKAVGTGPKGNRDLNFEESKDMMQQILNRKVYDEQIAAFLLGWRLKPETIEEFQGALSAFDSFIVKEPIPDSIELGYPFDGKAKHPYIFPLVGNVLKKADLNLILAGDEVQPAKDGITTKHIQEKITFSDNIKYFSRENFFPELHALTEIRSKLGLRTGLNTIEKLPHIANSKHAITGVFHKPYVEKYMKIFSSRYQRFALLKGNEGTPEIFTKGTLWISENETIKEFEIDPKYYGINIEKSLEKISLEESIDFIQNPTDEYLKLAKLNGAIYLFVSNKVNSIEEGMDYLV